MYGSCEANESCFKSNMGAKNHAVVMPDASVDATVNALIAAGLGAAVQRCMATSTVIFVGGSKPWYLALLCFDLIRVYYDL